jgi:hypothetical protein
MTRTREAIGMLLIGDGVVGAVFPQRHVRRWKRGPRWWQQFMRAFVRHPLWTRLLAVAELVAGVWYVKRLPPST